MWQWKPTRSFPASTGGRDAQQETYGFSLSGNGKHIAHGEGGHDRCCCGPAVRQGATRPRGSDYRRSHPSPAPISLQLYSLREQAAKDFAGTVRMVADMGFIRAEPPPRSGRSQAYSWNPPPGWTAGTWNTSASHQSRSSDADFYVHTCSQPAHAMGDIRQDTRA
jgi:hypothetical protein